MQGKPRTLMFEEQSTSKCRSVNVNAKDYSTEDGEWRLVKGAKSSKSTTLEYDSMFKESLQSEWRRDNRFAHLKDDQSSLGSESELEDNTNRKSVVTSIHTFDKTYATKENMKENVTDTSGNCDKENAQLGKYNMIVDAIKEAAQTSATNISADDMEEIEAIDVRTVIKMFNTLQIKMDQESGTNEAALRKELAEYKRKSEIMSGVIGRLGEIIDTVERKVDQLEYRGLRRHLVVSGLNTGNKVTDCISQVEQFLKYQLKIEINIIDSFKLGNGAKKPVVIQVESIVDRATIFQAMEMYKKQFENNAERSQTIFITDYLPAEMREAKRKERDIYKRNEKDITNQIPMQISKGTLMIQGQVYQAVITPPEPTKVLTYTEKQLDDIYGLDMQIGEKLTHEGSSFLAYMIPANSHLIVDNAYMKLRLKHPFAKSIMCAYSIPGMPRYNHEEMCDDKEIGGGRIIMNEIKKSQLTNIAIFVVQLHKGVNIGQMRFTLINQAIRKVMEKNPFNKYTNSRQSLKQNGLSQSAQKGEENTMRRGNGPTRSMRLPRQTNTSRGNRPQCPSDNFSESNNKRRRQLSPGTYNFQFEKPHDVLPPSFAEVTQEWGTFTPLDNDLGSSWPTLTASKSM